MSSRSARVLPRRSSRRGREQNNSSNKPSVVFRGFLGISVFCSQINLKDRTASTPQNAGPGDWQRTTSAALHSAHEICDFPNDDKQPPYDPAVPEQKQFGNPVHCITIANDGLVYVCDRRQNRIQVFKKDGSSEKEWFYEKDSRGDGAVFDLALWPDPKQTCLLNDLLK